jgi:hypothetical protein
MMKQHEDAQTPESPSPKGGADHAPLEFPRWVYPKDGSPALVADTPDDYKPSEHSLTPVTATHRVNDETAEAIEDAAAPPRELDKLLHPDITQSGHSPAPAPPAPPRRKAKA